VACIILQVLHCTTWEPYCTVILHDDNGPVARNPRTPRHHLSQTRSYERRRRWPRPPRRRHCGPQTRSWTPGTVEPYQRLRPVRTPPRPGDPKTRTCPGSYGCASGDTPPLKPVIPDLEAQTRKNSKTRRSGDPETRRPGDPEIRRPAHRDPHTQTRRPRDPTTHV
jgi:hypothetical protein